MGVVEGGGNVRERLFEGVELVEEVRSRAVGSHDWYEVVVGCSISVEGHRSRELIVCGYGSSVGRAVLAEGTARIDCCLASTLYCFPADRSHSAGVVVGDVVVRLCCWTWLPWLDVSSCCYRKAPLL